MTNPVPADVLEQRAADQRQQLHASVMELRSSLREKLDVRRAARHYLLPATGIAAALGLALGYRFGGIFSRE